MKNRELKKLFKAVELMKKAQALVNEVAAKDEAFRYSANSGYRDNRIHAAISIMQTEIQQADPDPDGMNEFLNGAKDKGFDVSLIS